MHCNTRLQVMPVGARLPLGLALVLVLSVLLQSSPVATQPQQWCLPLATVVGGRWRRVSGQQRWRITSGSWLGLLGRCLARVGLLALLLQSSGWGQNAAVRWAVLLVPVGQMLSVGLALNTCRWARRWTPHWQRLYQLTLLFLLFSTLGQWFHHSQTQPRLLFFPLSVRSWRTPPEAKAEIHIDTLQENRYWVTLRGNFNLLLEPRDSFELWMYTLVLRQLQPEGTHRPCLTQEQVACGFNTNQSAVSHWEGQVRQHGWHYLSDRYRHQLNAQLPDRERSRAILRVWVPAFWLSAWEVRERLIASGVIADRDALSLEALHALAHHTGFAEVRKLLLERFHLQGQQLIPKEHWWLKELSVLNERLLRQLEQGTPLTPQELVAIEALRLPVPDDTVPAPRPALPLAAALQGTLFQPSHSSCDPAVHCTYCGSDQVAPKSKTPRLKTIIDPFSGHKHQLEVLRYYCRNLACAVKSFTHLPPGLLPHSPYPLQTRLLALELYTNLLSTYRRSARLLGVKAPTLYRWLLSFSGAAQALTAYLGVIRTSGVIGIDDKWIKVCSPSAVPPHGRRPRAVWRYAYFAVDVYTYDLLALELYPQHNDAAVRLLLLHLKAKGISPRVVVTDLDPAYTRMLPLVFPRAVHHECIFHALQNAHSQLTQVYGPRYHHKIPSAAQLHDDIVHLFHARTQKTVRKRFATLLDSRPSYVEQTPAVACVFDSLERHFPKLINAIENPLIPRTNNTAELVIRRFDQHYQSMCGFDSFASARHYLRLFELVYRLTPFADDNPSPIAGRCPLQLAGYDLDALPIADFFLHLKLPSLALSSPEVVPMS